MSFLIFLAFGDSLNPSHICRLCEGRGKIQIYRNDWEDFDEIPCENCILSFEKEGK